MRFAPALALVALLARSAAAEPAGDTLTVQLKGAGYGVLLGGGIGLLSGLALGNGKDKLPGVLAGAGLGLLFGIPIGVQRTADADGGTGKSWGTALGSAIGIAAASASIYGMRKEKDRRMSSSRSS